MSLLFSDSFPRNSRFTRSKRRRAIIYKRKASPVIKDLSEDTETILKSPELASDLPPTDTTLLSDPKLNWSAEETSSPAFELPAAKRRAVQRNSDHASSGTDSDDGSYHVDLPEDVGSAEEFKTMVGEFVIGKDRNDKLDDELTCSIYKHINKFPQKIISLIDHDYLRARSIRRENLEKCAGCLCEKVMHVDLYVYSHAAVRRKFASVCRKCKQKLDLYKRTQSLWSSLCCAIDPELKHESVKAIAEKATGEFVEIVLAVSEIANRKITPSVFRIRSRMKAKIP